MGKRKEEGIRVGGKVASWSSGNGRPGSRGRTTYKAITSCISSPPTSTSSP